MGPRQSRPNSATPLTSKPRAGPTLLLLPLLLGLLPLLRGVARRFQVDADPVAH